MKIRFIEKHIVRGQTRAEDEIFEKDQIVDYSDDPVGNSYGRAYIERGHAVEHDAPSERPKTFAADARSGKDKSNDGKNVDARLAAKLDARGKVFIPADLTKMKDSEMIDLGQSLSDEPVKTKEDAQKAIDAEKVRRNPSI